MTPSTERTPQQPLQPLQPLLSDAVIALRAPTQVWSGRDGDLGGAPIDGVYHGDVRHVRGLTLECAESAVEYISVAPEGASHVVFGGLLRGADDDQPDPKVRLVRDRRVSDGSLAETWTVSSHLPEATRVTLRLRLRPDFAVMHDVKAGLAGTGSDSTTGTGDGPGDGFVNDDGLVNDDGDGLVDDDTHVNGLVNDDGDGDGQGDLDVTVAPGSATARSGTRSFTLTAAGATVTTGATGEIEATWPLDVPARGQAEAAWSLALHDDSLVVRGADGTWPGSSPGTWPGSPSGADPADVPPGADPRLGRWLDTALDDLDALRLALPDHPADEFFAAGAPWFFTLFGRDALWAARLALPLDTRIAASTLRVLARLQGTTNDVATAQEPGKILHELRATPLEIPGEGVVLPPLYYGSVDSTPLWVCLLADAWHAGMPDDDVAALLPALRRALTWLLEHGDSDGDGFIDYIDRSGRGLANQGWKDSGDSIQWRDGTLAEGPIALCEVQGYAYEAALAGADLLEAFDPAPSGPLHSAALRAWAADLRTRFAQAYWVETPEGRYPAVALDRDKRPVDTLTSNIGHLLGTGILDATEEGHVADLLLGPTMSTGFGIRTMSAGAAGYWPLSYHGGSVWTHDTAIAVHGMHRAGLAEHARQAVDGLLAAAEGFAYRVPELHSGDPATRAGVPTPYPAACRPQAWSAAAAITCLAVSRVDLDARTSRLPAT
ncbi:glycogen debranching enzyme-like protein [Promicromonospora sp. AC04]|uniref:glycogen debranching N-terminal domain-containing protein n=1 Tax=Promicromonospora sp. AC04 TaxID=2135723 RepID=UPI000D3C7A63|nr:glycogen debranching N-terminal domain-containing protein [Promicromonospora sp. AC04]PUB26973.1 glycogen debranching enzyme-like protein [Promicromonospora sp. AC04]